VWLVFAALAMAPAWAAEGQEPLPGLELRHVDPLGQGHRGFSLRSVQYELDGRPLVTEGVSRGPSGGLRWEVPPGVHELGIRLVYEGRSGMFRYVEGYRFTMRGRVTFLARPGYTLEVWSTGFAREGWTLPWEELPGFRIEGQPRRDILAIEQDSVEREPLGEEAVPPEVMEARAEQVVEEVLEEARARVPRQPCAVEPVLFDFADTRLRPEAHEPLLRLARCLLRQPSLRVRLVGHCDDRGAESLNANLGLGRARTVASFLESQGVPPSQLELGTLGEERLACPDHSESCYALNRRVELIALP
jgi:peptidoglycan-associated lipoprotein